MWDNFWHKWLKRPYKLNRSVSLGNSSGEQILLIHGLGASGSAWKPLYEELDQNKWKIIAFDLLGFGESPAPEHNSYDVSQHSKMITASLNFNEKTEPITIVGHSMGCLVASHLAYKNPEWVSRLILYEPPLFADSAEFRSHVRRKKFYFAFYSQLLKRPGLLLAYSKILGRINTRMAQIGKISSWTAFEKSLKNTVMSQKSYYELKNIVIPTDIIYGSYDFIVTRKEVKKMLMSNKYIRFHLVKESHFITKKAAGYIKTVLNLDPPINDTSQEPNLLNGNTRSS